MIARVVARLLKYLQSNECVSCAVLLTQIDEAYGGRALAEKDLAETLRQLRRCRRDLADAHEHVKRLKSIASGGRP